MERHLSQGADKLCDCGSQTCAKVGQLIFKAQVYRNLVETRYFLPHPVDKLLRQIVKAPHLHYKRRDQN